MSPILPASLRPLLSAPDALIKDAALSLDNPAWDEAGSRILIVRLSPFKDVTRSSPHLVLFSECRSALPESFLDFAFFPDRRDRELLSERKLPWFYGLASGRPPGDYDLVMVSLSFGLELVNLPYLLATAGLGLSASARSASRARGESSPLFILGGSSVAAAGSLLIGDGDAMVDGFFFGEGEDAIGELASILSNPRAAASERLERARRVEGFWVPGGATSPRRRVARPAPPPLASYPALNSAEASTARLQITAGCPGLCSFCLEGWDRRPYRELPLEKIVVSARELRARSGADTLEVYSFNFNTHARVFELLFELNRVFKRVNLMSQRIDVLASTRGLVRAELAADKRSFTLGIEGISRRMRAYYRKGITDDDIDAALDLLVARGVRELKLFYIVSGLEDGTDLAEFDAFASSLRERRAASAPGLRILASAGYLVRLPSTPLQYAPLALDEARLSAIAGALRSSCEENAIEFRLASHFDEYCADQTLSLSGARVQPWLASVPASGFCYDGSLSRGAWRSLESFAKSAGILDEAFLGEKGAEWAPPLCFGDSAVLRSHYEAACGREDRPPCLGSGCSGCGACADAADAGAIAGHAASPMPEGGFIDRLSRLIAAKASFAEVYAEVALPEPLAGATAEYRSSWLMRRLSAASPGVEAALFEASEVLFSAGPLSGMLTPPFTGLCVFALSGPSPTRIREAASAAGLAILEAVPAVSWAEVEVEVPPPWTTGALAAMRAWLAEERVGFVESRVGSARRLEASPRDARKRILLSAVVEEGEPFKARVVIGAKARIPDWIGRLGPRALLACRVRVLAYGDQP